MIAEEWRPVVGYEGRYSVSSLGRVRRDAGGKGATAGRILKPLPSRRRNGYLQVHLYTNDRPRTLKVHWLVAAAFLGPRPPGLDVNHKDGHKPNNAATNLEYLSGEGNRHHASRLGLLPRGERHVNAKLSAQDVREIRALHSVVTQRELASRYGVAFQTISRIIAGTAWRQELSA